MKIAFITHYTTLLGANRSLLNLIDGLSDLGVQAHLVSPGDGPIIEEAKKRNIPFVIHNYYWWMADNQRKKDILARLYHNFRAFRDMRGTVKKWHIDVFYTNSSVISIGFMLSTYFLKPHIWHFREFSDLHYHLYCDLGFYVTGKIFNSSSSVIAISESLKKDSLLKYKIQQSKFNVVYNGVVYDNQICSLYEMQKDKVISENSYCFVLVGLIHPNKGQHIAIKAIKILSSKHKNIKLLLVGDGEIEKAKSLVNHLGLNDYVEFWGYIEDPYDAFLKADAALMCSKHEALGRVTIEAMSACLPVIGYNQGGTSEIIIHEKTGLLYDGDEHNLAKCMERFIENKEWARKMGLYGWEIAREKYTIENYAQKIYKIIKESVNANQSAENQTHHHHPCI